MSVLLFRYDGNFGKGIPSYSALLSCTKYTSFVLSCCNRHCTVYGSSPLPYLHLSLQAALYAPWERGGGLDGLSEQFRAWPIAMELAGFEMHIIHGCLAFTFVHALAPVHSRAPSRIFLLRMRGTLARAVSTGAALGTPRTGRSRPSLGGRGTALSAPVVRAPQSVRPASVSEMEGILPAGTRQTRRPLQPRQRRPACCGP